VALKAENQALTVSNSNSGERRCSVLGLLTALASGEGAFPACF
jgi:hypothetical protein